MHDKKTAKEKRNLVLTIIVCVTIICFSIITSISNVSTIFLKTKEKEQLTLKLENLEDEEKTLNDDVEKLKNPEYAARYAREKYLYSKNGEKILKID